MSMMIFTLLISITILIFSNFPMIIILGIILSTISGSSIMIMNNNVSWMSLMIIMLFVGGLMIIYIFILSMSSNEKMKNKSKMLLFIFNLSLLILFMIFSQKTSKNKFGSLMYSMEWEMLMMIMCSIIFTMIFMSKMIFNPSINSKSMK